ncbi:hypothetical protein Ddc_16093 [Ditylenchus destructor]|nr:hypothetical protein Ddc_16093 [Ditylenchus destructor]
MSHRTIQTVRSRNAHGSWALPHENSAIIAPHINREAIGDMALGAKWGKKTWMGMCPMVSTLEIGSEEEAENGSHMPAKWGHGSCLSR